MRTEISQRGYVAYDRHLDVWFLLFSSYHITLNLGVNRSFHFHILVIVLHVFWINFATVDKIIVSV